MAGKNYTKADYDNLYWFNAEAEWGHPNTRGPVWLHYNYGVMAPNLAKRWDWIVPHVGMQSTDHVVVSGCGFGWGIERIVELLPGINVVGLDISDYIIDNADTTEEADINAAITAVGLDPNTGRGAQIKAKYLPPGRNRKAAGITLLQEDLSTNQSKQRVRQALGNNWPNWVFTEDWMQDQSAAEAASFAGDVALLEANGGTIVHLMSTDTDVSGFLTVDQVAAATGQWVIHYGTEGIIREVNAP